MEGDLCIIKPADLKLLNSVRWYGKGHGYGQKGQNPTLHFLHEWHVYSSITAALGTSAVSDSVFSAAGVEVSLLSSSLRG